ncbi:MAG: DUF11 domain-containing protein, partial [Chloroflexota bacterium]
LQIVYHTVPRISGQLQNSVEIQPLNGLDPISENNFTNAQVTHYRMADLALSKAGQVLESTEVTQTVVYQIEVLNQGPDTAIDFFVQDVLPSELVYQDHDNGGAELIGGDTLVWEPASLLVGLTVTLNITTTVQRNEVSQIIITNTASIISSEIPDAFTENNTDSAVLTIAPLNSPEPIDETGQLYLPFINSSKSSNEGGEVIGP